MKCETALRKPSPAYINFRKGVHGAAEDIDLRCDFDALLGRVQTRHNAFLGIRLNIGVLFIQLWQALAECHFWNLRSRGACARPLLRAYWFVAYEALGMDSC